MAYLIRFVGGPRDGEEWVVPELLDEIRFAYGPSGGPSLTADLPVEYQILVYRKSTTGGLVTTYEYAGVIER